MNYKAVVADVDGTLIAPGAHPKTKATNRLIKDLAAIRKLGVAFTLATARSRYWVEGLIDSLSLRDPIIFDNGARIYDPIQKKYTFIAHVPQQTVKKVLMMMKKQSFEIHIVNGDKRFIYDPKKRRVLDEVVKIIVSNMPKDIAENLYQNLQKLSDITLTKSVSRVNPLGVSIHITNIEGNKGKALLRLAKMLSIKPSEIIGIGDSHNDIELLEECGLKVAMGNAEPEIRDLADFIAPSYEEDGVAQVLEKFIINTV